MLVSMIGAYCLTRERIKLAMPVAPVTKTPYMTTELWTPFGPSPALNTPQTRFQAARSFSRVPQASVPATLLPDSARVPPAATPADMPSNWAKIPSNWVRRPSNRAIVDRGASVSAPPPSRLAPPPSSRSSSVSSLTAASAVACGPSASLASTDVLQEQRTINLLMIAQRPSTNRPTRLLTHE